MQRSNGSFLVDCLKYKVGSSTEDRLTAIVTSSFNHSTIFKKAFCNFLHIAYSNDLTAQQQHKGKKSRPDLVISSKNGKIVAIIESKTESEINLKQLKNHSTILARKYFFISKYTIEQSIIPKPWVSLQWRDLTIELSSSKNDFICNEVFIYLKEQNMIPPEQISITDIEKCSKLLNSIRYHANPEVANLLVSLESLNKIAEILQFAAREIIVDIKKFSGKKPKVKLTYFYNHQPTVKEISRNKRKTDADILKLHSYASVALAVYFELTNKTKPFVALRMKNNSKMSWGNSSKISSDAEIIAGSFKKNWTYDNESIIKFKNNKLSLYDLKKQVCEAWE